MEIKYGTGIATEGPGIDIKLTGDEVAIAIRAWLVARGVVTVGPITIRVNGELCREGNVYVDPAGYVNVNDQHTVFGHGIDRVPFGNDTDLVRGKFAGFCVEGEKHCVCGGDLPRVRADCTNWRKA